MPSRLQQEIEQSRPFETPELEAYLNVWRTQDRLCGEVSRFLKGFGISLPQYNALRILRGAGSPGLPCLKVAQRMVARVPDITRLLGRMERAGLVERERLASDRRVVRARVTRQGLKLLEKIHEPLLEFHRQQLGHLTPAELTQLSRLLEKARTPPSAEPPQ